MKKENAFNRRQFLQSTGAAIAGTMFMTPFHKKTTGKPFSSISEANIGPLRSTPAFPGAWGAGMYATGGRGGRVIKVTNLNDFGAGSLRAAVEAEGPRIVVFEVGGTIELRSNLEIENPDITIAGQTAPGDGICLRGATLVVRADNTIVRYLRVRRGDENTRPDDGIGVVDAEKVMIDHCTISWTTDEAINAWHGGKDVTYQWCLIAESLNDSVHYKGEHAYGASIGGINTTYHHNLLAHHTARNPSIAGNHEHSTINLDWRNNLVYNWGHRTLDGKPDSINVINNYYKPGPATTLKDRLVRIDNRSTYDLPVGTWYVDGNVIEGMKEYTDDNWRDLVMVQLEDGVTVQDARINQPHEVEPVPTQKADEIVDPILQHVGVTVPYRDPWEVRIISEVRTGTAPFGSNGIIDSQNEVGGWPYLRSSEPCLDSDGDGIPDWWKIKYGLNPEDPAEADQDLNNNGYTTIEEYLNGIDLTKGMDYTLAENNRNPLHENPSLLFPH